MHCEDCKFTAYLGATAFLTCENPKVSFSHKVPKGGLRIVTNDTYGFIVDHEFGCINFEQYEEPEDKNGDLIDPTKDEED